MKKVLLCAVVVFCLVTVHTNAQIEWDVNKFMPISDIKPGMKGKGYTVFSGTNAEEFTFEVVSIIYNDASPGWHVVWAEGTSENFKRTGVAGGMSGSPVYIDGRLMGAISLGYFNQRERSNIFGITPFELMVKVSEHGMKPNLLYAGEQFLYMGSEYVNGGLNMIPSPVNEGRIEKINHHTPDSLIDSRIGIDWNMSQLAIPITLPRLDPATMQLLKPFFERGNMIPLQGMGGGGPVKESPVEGGQTIGSEVLRGDVAGFGFGTITYVDKDKKQLLAYGHPAFSEGNVNLPLSGGHVHFILPSRTRSSKVASATQPIGTLVQDRVPAIAGIIQDVPNTHHYLPVSVKIQTSDNKVHEKYYEAARDKMFTAIYASSGISSLINAMEFSGNDYTINVNAKIKLRDQPELDTNELVLNNTYSSSGSPAFSASQLVMGPLMDLIVNPYTKVRVDAIDFDVKVEDKRKTASILTTYVDKQVYRPGEEITITLSIRPYLEKPKTMTASIKIPDDTTDGIVLLRGMSAGSYRSWRFSRAPGNFQAKNINHLIELWQNDRQPNTDLILEISQQKPGLTVQGQEFSDLPISVMAVMNTGLRIGENRYTNGTELQTNIVNTDYIIIGSFSLPIAINSNSQ